MPSRPQAPGADKRGKTPHYPSPREKTSNGRESSGLGLGPVLLASAGPLAGMVCVPGGRGGADRSPAPPPLRSSLAVRFGSTGAGRGVGSSHTSPAGGAHGPRRRVACTLLSCWGGFLFWTSPRRQLPERVPHLVLSEIRRPARIRSDPLGFAQTELRWETRTSSPQDGGSQPMAWVWGGHRRRQGPEPPGPRGGRGLGEGRSQD